jgi:hypothetical protein
LPSPLVVRCGRTTSSRSDSAPRTAVPSAQEDLPCTYGCSRGARSSSPSSGKAGSTVVERPSHGVRRRAARAPGELRADIMPAPFRNACTARSGCACSSLALTLAYADTILDVVMAAIVRVKTTKPHVIMPLRSDEERAPAGAGRVPRLLRRLPGNPLPATRHSSEPDYGRRRAIGRRELPYSS